MTIAMCACTQVSELLPQATLVDDAAGSLSFALREADIGKAAPLLRHIEALQQQGTAEIVNWLVTHCALLVRIARTPSLSHSHDTLAPLAAARSGRSEEAPASPPSACSDP